MTDSPFPGMDPYLEYHWRSVHHRLITYLGDQLQSVLPPAFRVEVEERVFVSGEAEDRRSIAPDIYVTQRPSEKLTQPSGGSITTKPVVIELSDEPTTEAYLEIIDTTSGDKVITAIELLSPTNKLYGDGNELYVRKQREYRIAKVNQVEIDLTRTGDRGLVFPLHLIPHNLKTTYMACIRRGEAPAKIEIYPMPINQPLPVIAIPLGHDQKDAPLDLQAALTACYRNGRYGDIDYTQPLRPALAQPDAIWLEERMKSLGLMR
jgi:hypothetical protein